MINLLFCHCDNFVTLDYAVTLNVWRGAMSFLDSKGLSQIEGASLSDVLTV